MRHVIEIELVHSKWTTLNEIISFNYSDLVLYFIISILIFDHYAKLLHAICVWKSAPFLFRKVVVKR